MRLEGGGEARAQVPGPGGQSVPSSIWGHTQVCRGELLSVVLRVLGAIRPAGLEPEGKAGDCEAHAKAMRREWATRREVLEQC